MIEFNDIFVNGERMVRLGVIVAADVAEAVKAAIVEAANPKPKAEKAKGKNAESGE